MTVRLITPHAEWFLDGRKTALLLPALSVDSYQEVPGGPWRLRDDGFEHGRPGSAVRHAFHGYVSEEGALIPLRSLRTREVIQIQVTGIHMVECNDLSDQELHDLGYATRDAFWQESGWLMAGQIGWFLSATLASRAPTLH
jgi:hypothetical protein